MGNLGLSCLASVLLQHLVIFHRPYPLSCQLHFVHLAVFHLGVFLDNGWMIRTEISLQKFLRLNTEKARNAHNWQSKFWLTLCDSRPIFHRQSMVNVSAESLYRPIVGQYVDRHSADTVVDISVDTSVDYQSICRPIYGRGVHKIHVINC